MRAAHTYFLWLALLIFRGCHTAPVPPVSPPVVSTPATGPVETTSPRQLSDYPWPHTAPFYEFLAGRFPAPAGFTRASVADRSYGQWLRYLPLRPPAAPVRGLDGAVLLPGDSPYLAGVIDLDLRRNQECADVIMRLRFEYLRWANREGEISVPAGDGVQLSWAKWKQGYRPVERRGRLSLVRSGNVNASRANFDRYLAAVFNWCGTYNLAEMGRTVSFGQLQPGDFFARGGSPGHAVILADVARDPAGHTRALLLQGYMPAQSAHLLTPGDGDPWFLLEPGQPVEVPGWGAFQWSNLRRFEDR